MLEKLLPKRPVRKSKSITQSQAKGAVVTRKPSRPIASKAPVTETSSDPAEEEDQTEGAKTGTKRKSVGASRPRGRPPKKPRIMPNLSVVGKKKGKARRVEETEKEVGSRTLGSRMKVEVFIATRPQDFVAGTSTVARAPKSYKSTNAKTNTKSRAMKGPGRGRASASAKENKGKRRQVESYDSESSVCC